MRPGKRPKPPLDKRRLRIIEGRKYFKKLTSSEIFAIHPKCTSLDVSVFNNIINNSLQVIIPLVLLKFNSQLQIAKIIKILISGPLLFPMRSGKGFSKVDVSKKCLLQIMYKNLNKLICK